MARTARQAFRSAMGRDPGRVHPFSQSLTREAMSPKALDRAALFHYWHPDRDAVEQAPEWFTKELNKIAGMDDRGRPNAVCVRPPAAAPVRCRCWLIFKRSPEVTNELSPGWFLVLAWHDGAEPLPKPLALDNRVLANLYLQSVKAGREVMGRDFDTAVQYFDHCMHVLDEDKKKQDRANDQYRDDRASDYYEFTKIKNIGHGSKFSLHHDGTLVPSRGERNWLRERGHSLPSDVVKRDREELRQAQGAKFAGSPSPMDRDRARETRQLIADLDRLRSRVSVGMQRPNLSPLDGKVR